MPILVSIILSFLCLCLLWFTARKLSVCVWSSPLTFICIQMFIGVFAKSVFLAVDSNAASKLKWGYEPNYLLDASIYLLFFTFLLVSGYALACKPVRLASAHRAANCIQFGNKDLWKLVVLCGSITVCVLLLLVAQKESFTSLLNVVDAEQFQSLQKGRVERIDGVEGYGNSHFSTTVFFSFNAMAFVVLTSLIYWRPSADREQARMIKICLIACCLVILLEVLVTGRRNILAGYFLLYGSVALSGIRSFTLRDVMIYAAGFCGVLFTLSIITVFRASSDAYASVDIHTLIESLMEPLFYAEYFMSITKLTVIMSQVKMETMLWGGSLIDWVLGVVPRPIWPDKPAVSLGPYVKSEIYGVSGTIGGIPPTFPGELYINFMWAGLLIAPIYGYALRSIENICFNSRNIAKYGAHWMYFFLIIPLTYGLMQNALSGAMINSIVRVVVGWFILVAILRIPKMRVQLRDRNPKRSLSPSRQ